MFDIFGIFPSRPLGPGPHQGSFAQGNQPNYSNRQEEFMRIVRAQHEYLHFQDRIDRLAASLEARGVSPETARQWAKAEVNEERNA